MKDWDLLKDLLRRMLCIDPERRISISQVLNHGWMVQTAMKFSLNITEYRIKNKKKNKAHNLKQLPKRRASIVLTKSNNNAEEETFGDRKTITRKLFSQKSGSIMDEEVENGLNFFIKRGREHHKSQSLFRQNSNPFKSDTDDGGNLLTDNEVNFRSKNNCETEEDDFEFKLTDRKPKKNKVDLKFTRKMRRNKSMFV